MRSLLLDNPNKTNSLDWHIDSVKDISMQLNSLRSYQGFYEEGKTFDKVEFNYFISLQSRFMQHKMEPVKFHSLIDTLPSHISVQGKRYQLKNNRTCFWDGSRLYLLSQRYVSQGSYSNFRRAVMIPQSETEELQFYAMLAPCSQDLSETQYLKHLRNDYTVSQHAYDYLYPYMRPRLIEYCMDNSNVSDQEDSLPALITRSYGEWHTLRQIIDDSERLTRVDVLSIVSWMLSVVIMHEQSCLHRDISDNNVLVYGPGVFCQLIDMSSAKKLDQSDQVKCLYPLSTFPDFSARFGVYDKQSDVFSLALNLIGFKFFGKKLWEKVGLNRLVDEANYTLIKDEDFQGKLERYRKIYQLIKVLNPISSSAVLLPHLLNLAHPDRSSRSSLIDVFSDKQIMHAIRSYIHEITVNSDFSIHFIAIKNWSLQRVLDDLYSHSDDSSITATTILMLLVYALHYEKLPNSIRINHKQHIECVLDHLNVTPFQSTVILHYESEFPGHLTKSLYFDCIDSLIDQIVSESINECIDINSVVRELCERTYNHVVQEDCNDVLDDLANQVVIRDESEVLLNKLMDIIEYRQKDSEDFIQQVTEAVINQVFENVDLRKNSEAASRFKQSLTISILSSFLLSFAVKYYQFNDFDSFALFLSLSITSLALAARNIFNDGDDMRNNSTYSYSKSSLFQTKHQDLIHDISPSKLSLAAV